MHKRVSFVLLILFLLGIFSTPVSYAQNCGGLTVENTSRQDLDLDQVCAAAQPMLNKGIQVFVYVTDNDPRTEDDWFALRDQIEIKWNIYDPTNETFSKNAFSIEFTTVTSRPWGHDIAFGERLFFTPLDDDRAVQLIEGRLKNAVAGGNLTAAVVDTLNSAYSTAFPAPVVVQPTQAPIATQVQATPRPTATREPQVIGVTTTREVEPIDFTPFLQAVGSFIAIVLTVFAIHALWTKVVQPGLETLQTNKQLGEHLTEVSAKTGKIIGAFDGLLKGDKPEDTPLYQWFKTYFGEMYPDLQERVINSLGAAKKGFYDAAVAYDALDVTYSEEKPGLRALIIGYETLYLTLVGVSNAIGKLNESQWLSFIDPYDISDFSETDSPWKTQLQESMMNLGTTNLYLKTKLVDLNSIKTEGIFQYILEVKKIIAQLVEARDNSQATFTQTEELRAGPWLLPHGLTEAQVFVQVDALLAEARNEAEAYRWINVISILKKAQQLIKTIEELLPDVIEGVRLSEDRMAQITGQASEGYVFSFLATAQNEYHKSLKTLFERLANGEVDAVQRALGNIIDETLLASKQAESHITLHKTNETRLAKLIKETANLLTFREETVQPAWDTLQSYHRANWEDLVEKLAAADSLHASLQDDPANETDIVSTLRRLNSLSEQKLVEAEKLLNEAFDTAASIQQTFQTVLDRLVSVEALKASLPKTLQETAQAIEKAVVRRNRDNPHISADVDAMITKAEGLFTSATSFNQDMRFTEANALAMEAQALAVNAHTESTKQAKEIQSLFTKVSAIKAKVTASLTEILHDLAGTISAIRKDDVTLTVNRAQEYLKKAQQSEADLTGKEDKKLLEQLKITLKAYQVVEGELKTAASQLQRNVKTYTDAVNASQDAIRTAQDAIRRANNLIDSGAGATSLSLAQQALPNYPGEGAAIAALERATREANNAYELARKAQQQAEEQIARIRAEEQRQREAREAAERAERQRLQAIEDARRAQERAAEEARRAQERAEEERRRRDREDEERRQESFRRSSSMSITSSSHSDSSMGSSRRR